MLDSWSRANGSGGRLLLLQAHHHDVLRLEIKRRVASRAADADGKGAGAARAAFAAVALDCKVVELVADARDADELASFERSQTAALDEQGLQSWWRRTA
ncbi:MAG: hypothetical protein AB8H79_22025 [Myxococcota bacterium]